MKGVGDRKYLAGFISQSYEKRIEMAVPVVEISKYIF